MNKAEELFSQLAAMRLKDELPDNWIVNPMNFTMTLNIIKNGECIRIAVGSNNGRISFVACEDDVDGFSDVIAFDRPFDGGFAKSVWGKFDGDDSGNTSRGWRIL